MDIAGKRKSQDQEEKSLRRSLIMTVTRITKYYNKINCSTVKKKKIK